MKKVLAIGMVIVLLTSLFVGVVPSSIALSDDWDINGDTVEREDGNVYMGATPHTISSGGYVYFDFIPKAYTGDIDVVWGFNVSNVKPTKAELYHPHWNNWTTDHEQFFYNVSSFSASSDSCDFGNSYNSLHYNVTYETCDVWNENTFECEGYKTVSSIVCFDSHLQEGNNHTAYWHTNHSKLILWTDISSSFTKINYNHGGMNTWYYVKNVPVVAGHSYQVRAWVDVPISIDGVSGKYWWAVKPSSENISQAISSGYFYALDPWYSSSWSKRKQWTITNVNATTLTDYSAYLNVSDEPEMQADWDDVVLTDSASNLIDYELENYTAGFGDYFVNLSSLPGSGTYTGWAYYGNDGASSQENPEGVWDFSTAMVQLSQDLIDSTSNNNDATNHGATYIPSGMVDGAYDYNGSSDYLDCGNDASLNITDAITIEAWVKRANEVGTVTYEAIVSKWSQCYILYIYIDKINFRIKNSTGTEIKLTGNTVLQKDMWYHLVATYDGDYLKVYVNGVSDKTPLAHSDSIQSWLAEVLRIGKDWSTNYFNGTIDNVIMSSTARSADWINQSYELVVNQSTWVTWGSPEVSIPVITLLSQTPSAIYQNSTGSLNISYGITHCSAGLNNTSISYIYRNYDHDLSDSNHSIRPPPNNKSAIWNYNGRILRGANRNETLNFENNDTITGGDIYTWSGLDENNTRLTIVPVNSTYTKVYINGTIHDLMPQMWYLDRSDLQEAPKTQLGIHKTQNVLIKFWNFEIFKGNYNYVGVGYTDTSLKTSPSLHPSDANPINYYYVNSSYDPATGGDPLASGYAVYMGSLNASGWTDHVYKPHANSSYVRGFINGSLLHSYIDTTNISYLYFTSNTPSSKPYYINVTNVPTHTNVSFADTNVLWAGNTAPYTPQSYTPNNWFAFMKTNMSFDHKLYAADNNNHWANSTLNSTLVGKALFPPTKPTISHFHYPLGSVDYAMNGSYSGTFDVGVGIGTDPDGGIVTHNLTLHYGNKTFVAIINNTFTEADAMHNGPHADISFNSTPYYSDIENYTMKVVATDDEGKTSQSWLGVNFSLFPIPNITSWWNDFTKDNQTSLVVEYTQEENRTIFFNVSTNQSIDYWVWYKDDVLVQNSSADNYTASWDSGGSYTIKVYGINVYGETPTLTWDVKIENSLYEQNILLLDENKMIGLSLLLGVLIIVGIIFFLLGIILPHSVLTLLGSMTFFVTMVLPISVLSDYPYFGIALTSILLLFGLIGVIITFWQFFTTYNSDKGYHKWDDYFNNQ